MSSKKKTDTDENQKNQECSSSKRTSDTNSVTNQQLVESIFDAYSPDGTEDKKNSTKTMIIRYITEQIQKHKIAEKYNIAFLYDELTMVQSDADYIYSAVTKFSEKKPILLILHSSGGNVGPAYLIGKLLIEYSDGNFDVVVPRSAKSAATLLCCAANRIHMGSLSELGPIDPQLDGLPALGLKSAIQHIAALVAEYPQAIDLFSRYMSLTIKPIHLGYYERIAESAAQYAERLLETHSDDLCQAPSKISNDLVYSYMDHGFVIDKNEALGIFGDKVVKHNTEEYHLGNSVYRALYFISRIAAVVNQTFYFIGSLATDPGFIKSAT